MLLEIISVDNKTYLKSKEENKNDKAKVNEINTKLAIISVLKDKLEKLEKTKKNALTPEEEYGIVKKLREDTEEPRKDYIKYNRPEAIVQLELELTVIDEYIKVLLPHIPVQLDEAGILDKVKEFAATLGRTDFSMKDKGLFMKNLCTSLEGQADTKLINKIVTEFLN